MLLVLVGTAAGGTVAVVVASTGSDRLKSV